MDRRIEFGKNMREALVALATGAGLALALAVALGGLSIVDLLSATAVVFVYVAIFAGGGILCAGAVVDLLRGGIFLTCSPLHHTWALAFPFKSRLFSPSAPPPRGALSA